MAASVATGETRGLAIQSLLFYSVAYSFMNLGAFGVVTFLGSAVRSLLPSAITPDCRAGAPGWPR